MVTRLVCSCNLSYLSSLRSVSAQVVSPSRVACSFGVRIRGRNGVLRGAPTSQGTPPLHMILDLLDE